MLVRKCQLRVDLKKKKQYGGKQDGRHVCHVFRQFDVFHCYVASRSRQFIKS